jgi:hypothetical protein
MERRRRRKKKGVAGTNTVPLVTRVQLPCHDGQRQKRQAWPAAAVWRE